MIPDQPQLFFADLHTHLQQPGLALGVNISLQLPHLKGSHNTNYIWPLMIAECLCLPNHYIKARKRLSLTHWENRKLIYGDQFHRILQILNRRHAHTHIES